jgi:hypothetical protein
VSNREPKFKVVSNKEFSHIKRSFQKTEEETEMSQRLVSPLGGAAQALAVPPYGEGHLVHF